VLVLEVTILFLKATKKSPRTALFELERTTLNIMYKNGLETDWLGNVYYNTIYAFNVGLLHFLSSQIMHKINCKTK